ncbi:MAG: hypothetical protein ABL995_16330 [Bryobacteraceae bacterium]
MFRAGLLLVSLSVFAAAQSAVKIPFTCTEKDMDQFGLTCTEEEPCPVFLEVSSVDSGAGRLIATGNLHTKNQTLYGVVLSSEDSGLTWKDGYTRIPFGSLEQVQFLDLQTGWISGESLDPLARNPFFLITTDGGKTWRQKLIFEDTKYGTVAQFRFDSATHGQFILDASQGRNTRQELYESNTGGESWEVRETSNKKLQLAGAGPGSFRVRVDAKADTFVVERGGGRAWDAIASFQVHTGDCGAPVPATGKDAE